ncbi:hypothetical protein NQ318_008730 [Aromia moschata]|uniref:Uncharacterized protein n=1 Tax=Aromia moschata TaxID=1265417 RepID=A0AAV8XD09_9CUCU|nr:hypothetical protein NQ318_008730 [Aromia moschata]
MGYRDMQKSKTQDQVCVLFNELDSNRSTINQPTIVKYVFKPKELRPYKLQLVHELDEDDFDRRAEFCESERQVLRIC